MVSSPISYLNRNGFRTIQDWFSCYTKSFYSREEYCQYNILLKRNHSFRVSSLAGRICDQLKLRPEDCWLARIIGLLHDVGRFEQFSLYKTFRDSQSFDHGEYGVNVLKKSKILERFEPVTRQIITCAVRYHNNASIAEGLGEGQLLHTRLVRDADKLDILYLTCREMLGNKAGMPGSGRVNGKFSQRVLDEVTKGRYVSYDSVTTEIDFQLLRVCWIYDLNFVPSLQMVRERSYLPIMKSQLPDMPEIRTLISQVDAYLDQQGVHRHE